MTTKTTAAATGGRRAEQIADFYQNGFIVARSLVDPALAGAVRPMALPMAPGDVLLFASRLFHHTPPNRSDHRRRALQIHYASSHCRLLPGRKARTHTLVRGQSKPGGI